MAKEVIVAPHATINSVDQSAFLTGFSLGRGRGEGEITTSGDPAEIFAPGLKTNTVTINFINDFAVGAIDEDMHAIHEAGVPVTIALRKSTDAVSTSNPEFTFSAFIKTLPLETTIKEVPVLAVEFSLSTDVTRATA